MNIDLPTQRRSPWGPAALAMGLVHSEKRSPVDLPPQKRLLRIPYARIGQAQAAPILAPLLDQTDGIDALRRTPIPFALLWTLRLTSQRHAAAEHLPSSLKDRQPSFMLLNNDAHAILPLPIPEL